jgi:hypothetical protein
MQPWDVDKPNDRRGYEKESGSIMVATPSTNLNDSPRRVADHDRSRAENIFRGVSSFVFPFHKEPFFTYTYKKESCMCYGEVRVS